MFLSDLDIPYIGDVAENPSAQRIIDSQINESILLSEFRRDFESQYKNYTDLGLDIIKSHTNEAIPIAVAEDFLDHVHNNIIPIPDYDIPNLSLSKKIFLTRVVYELLYIDFPNHFNEIFNTANDPITVRQGIIQYFEMSADILKHASEELSWRQIKASQALDIFDADLEMFVNNYVVPVRAILN